MKIHKNQCIWSRVVTCRGTDRQMWRSQ